MDVKVRISRTWQQAQFEPITVDIEVYQYDVEDYESAYKAAYDKVEASVIESEIKLRDMYTEDKKKPTEEEWDEPITNSRKPKRRKRT